MRLTPERRLAANAVASSSSYEEFKMKLGLGAVNLYNIDVLRTVRSRMLSKWSLFKEFLVDIQEHIDEVEPQDYIYNYIHSLFRQSAPNEKPSRNTAFNAFLLSCWLRKHNYDFGEIKHE